LFCQHSVERREDPEGWKNETSAIITEETEVLLNINTLKDLEIAEKIVREAKES
jgi:GTP:adenosylcobinamide-phosphate guanylyltransferase